MTMTVNLRQPIQTQPIRAELTIRQLPLPLMPLDLSPPPPRPTTVLPTTLPRQVWNSLSQSAQAEIHLAFLQVFQEAARDANESAEHSPA